MVAPLGVGFGSDSETGFWRRTVGFLEKLVNALLNLPSALLSATGQAVMGGLNGIVSSAEKAGCGVVGQLDGEEEGGPISLSDGGAGAEAHEGCEKATAQKTVTGAIVGGAGLGRGTV